MTNALLRVVLLSLVGGGTADASGIGSALAGVGPAAPLVASPIHAARPLEAEALTGLGRGEIGIFDDWRPEAYRPAPPLDPAPRLRPVTEAARQAGIAVLEGIEGLDHPAPTAIVRVPEARALEVAAWRPGEGATMIWLQPSASVRVRHVLNPQAALATAGLLEVDAAGRPDWNRTLAYHVGQGQVWVNLRGREPEGIVRPGDEYEDVRRALRRVLEERLVDPASGACVAPALPKETLYAGPWLWAAPDLVLCPAEGYGFSAAAVAGRVEPEVVRPEEAAARRPGCWGVAGWGAPGAWERGSVDILAVAPTLAEALGISLPRAAGPVLRERLTAAFWASRPAAPRPRGASLSPDEERLVTRRLGELGYLE